MTMSVQTIAFFFGLLMLAVAILGGGFEVKEVKISNVTPAVRLLAGVTGIAFVGLSFWQQNALLVTTTPAAPTTTGSIVPAAPDTMSLNGREGWQSADFPPPNAGWLAFRFIGGNPACASYDGYNCLWGVHLDQIHFDRIKPLVCGADHREKYKVTGYEDPKHWCNLAKPSP
ncbi:MAG TPA: hypothetical protein VII39_15950 [Bradyrhizobium sp.]